jgi:hypothetical protein
MRASDDYALDSTRQDAGLSAQGECQCGLPASVWAHKSQMLTLLELEIDTACKNDGAWRSATCVCVCMDGADKPHDRRDSVSETTRASKLIVCVCLCVCGWVRICADARGCGACVRWPQRWATEITAHSAGNSRKREDTFTWRALHSLSQHCSELDAERVVWISSTASQERSQRCRH